MFYTTEFSWNAVIICRKEKIDFILLGTSAIAAYHFRKSYCQQPQHVEYDSLPPTTPASVGTGDSHIHKDAMCSIFMVIHLLMWLGHVAIIPESFPFISPS